jgi:hypothetical protein
MAGITIVFGLVLCPGLLIAIQSIDRVIDMRALELGTVIHRNSWWMLGVAPVEATAVLLVLLSTTRDERVKACAATVAAAFVLGLFLTELVGFRPPPWLR